MGKVYINGKAYDSLTGLKLGDPANVDDSIMVEPVIDEPKQPVKVESQKQRRVSKQQRLAEAVAKEFEDEQRQSRGQNVQPITAEEESATPTWISNFAQGNDPIAIEPILARPSTPVDKISHRVSPLHNDHKRMQKSQTLNRNFVKKPIATLRSITRRVPAQTVKHPDVHHFTPSKARVIEDTLRPAPIVKVAPDKPFVPTLTHRTASRLIDNNIQDQPAIRISSRELKDALIKNQLDQPINNQSRSEAEKVARKFGSKRHFAVPTLITAALAVLVLGGYFTYVNMPSLSVRVAANKAGVDTEYPYTPNGYSIDGPVAYSPGRITIQYKSNSGAPGYSITGQNTDLSNNEIVDNFISSDTNQYETENINGITVYEYNGDAAWVDNGVLYKLNGNNLLSSDQLSKIVQSV